MLRIPLGGMYVYIFEHLYKQYQKAWKIHQRLSYFSKKQFWSKAIDTYQKSSQNNSIIKYIHLKKSNTCVLCGFYARINRIADFSHSRTVAINCRFPSFGRSRSMCVQSGFRHAISGPNSGWIQGRLPGLGGPGSRTGSWRLRAIKDLNK